MAPNFQPRFKRLPECEPGDLIRVALRHETGWALVILSGEGSPRMVKIDVTDDRGFSSVDRDFEDRPVLLYAKKDEYAITPDHTGECEIDGEIIFKTIGSLSLVNSFTLLRIASPSGGSGFLHLNDYQYSDFPLLRPRAAFKKWTLTCELFERCDPPFFLRGPPLTPRPKVPWDAFGWTGLDERASPAGS
jgi:hypothetical protein